MSKKFNLVTPDNFTLVNANMYGNQRYVCHLFDLLTIDERNSYGVDTYEHLYKLACKRANKIGGKKYRAKHYGGGIVFECGSMPVLCRRINTLLSELN